MKQTDMSTADIPSRSRVTAEQAISEEEALKKGMEEKSKKFVEKCAGVYAKA